MLIEDLSQKYSIATTKLLKADKELKAYEKMYNNVNISVLHQRIRDLESKNNLYKNHHVFKNRIEETFRMCTLCNNQIDRNGKQAKKLIIQGGRHQKDDGPVVLFLSSEEDADFKDAWQAHLLSQPKIMMDLSKQDAGQMGDLEDYNHEESSTSESNESNTNIAVVVKK